MKRSLIIIAIMVLLCAAVGLTACAPDLQYAEPTVVGIAVNGLSQDFYRAGDILLLDGASLLVTYSDGNTETINLTADMLSDYDMAVPEEGKVITVTYAGVTTTFSVDVFDMQFSSVVLKSKPKKTVYVEGERVRADGAVIAVKYEGGKEVDVPVSDGMLEEGYDNTRLGEQDIYVKYYGYRLFFKVTFVEKTAIRLTVKREPYQNSVFKGFGDKLSLEGMELKLRYDNDLEEEIKATDIADDLKIYFDDSVANTAKAYVAYLPEEFPETFVYTFDGSPLVRVGDYVRPGTALAGNKELDNTVSKSYGEVIEIGSGTMTVSTVVTYRALDVTCRANEIIGYDEEIGSYGSSRVRTAGGGGLVLSVGDGKVVVRTAPVDSFKILVKDKGYASMRIIRWPDTAKYNTNTRDEAIIQGDTLDLSTGKVEVTYDDGTRDEFQMDDTAHIRVVNSDDDNLRSQIEGLKFASVENVNNLPVGNYNLNYDITSPYSDDSLKVVVTVIDEDGRSEYVYDNRRVSLKEATNYTVSIEVTYYLAGRAYYSDCKYFISTEGAGPRESKLDITTAGPHKLLIYYGGIRTNSIPMPVTVESRYATKLLFVDGKDNISGKQFSKGSTIPLDKLEYYIVYNNGEESEPTGVTANMLGEGCSLYCDALTDENNKKTIFFTVPGKDGEPVNSAELRCDVIPAPITSLNWAVEPIDVFLGSPAESGSNDVNLTGGVLRMIYEEKRVVTIGDEDSGVSLSDLIGQESGRRIKLTYNPADNRSFTEDEIYLEGRYYSATLQYWDEDGATFTCPLKYYVIDDVVESIKASANMEQYKSSYIQCEKWDLTGVKITVNYTAGTTAVLDATDRMVYDTTTDALGSNIPLKFSYMGKTDLGSLTFNVKARKETGISVAQNGKDSYLNTAHSLDLSDYRFTVSYNAGADADVLGLRDEDFGGSFNKVGWWFVMYDAEHNPTTLRIPGKKIVGLYHTTMISNLIVTDNGEISTYDYNTVYTEFEITVSDSPYTVDYITYDDTSIGTYEGKNIISQTVRNWELFLSEYNPTLGRIEQKQITLHYYQRDDEGNILVDSHGNILEHEVGYAELTNAMLNYNKNEVTTGYRPVTITYMGLTTEAWVEVLRGELDGIAVEKIPCQNFIVGSDLTLDGGIFYCIFKIPVGVTEVTLFKYLYMDDEDVTVSGFNSNLTNADFGAADRQQQTITLTYRSKNTSYSVTVYNYQELTFHYQNTLFFYGNTAAATADALQLIPEFDLPQNDTNIMYYACDRDFIAADAFDGDPADYLKFLMEDGKYYYVPKLKLSLTHYYDPPDTGETYYLIMQVEGNDYYKKENYAYQKYTIVKKTAVVSIVDISERDYIKYYKANSGSAPAVIFYLYEHMREIKTALSAAGKFPSNLFSDIQMYSPSTAGFEIAVSVTDNYDEDTNFNELKAIFTFVEEILLKGDGSDANPEGFSITADVLRRGINIGEYNGIQPERITYSIAAKETLTRNGVLELFSGAPALTDYHYGIGTYRLNVGNMDQHKKYKIDFASGSFRVTKRRIDSHWFNGVGTYNESVNTLTVASGGVFSLSVGFGDDYTRQLAEAELGYYTTADFNEANRLDARPTATGTYYVKVGTGDNFLNADGTAPYNVNFTLVII